MATTGERPLDWVASSKKDFLSFPEAVKDEMGNALGIAQLGGKHPAAKPWKGEGPGVFEIVENHDATPIELCTPCDFRRSSMSCMPFKKSPRPGSRRL
jgi:phage-related protein